MRSPAAAAASRAAASRRPPPPPPPRPPTRVCEPGGCFLSRQRGELSSQRGEYSCPQRRQRRCRRKNQCPLRPPLPRRGGRQGAAPPTRRALLRQQRCRCGSGSGREGGGPRHAPRGQAIVEEGGRERGAAAAATATRNGERGSACRPNKRLNGCGGAKQDRQVGALRCRGGAPRAGRSCGSGNRQRHPRHRSRAAAAASAAAAAPLPLLPPPPQSHLPPLPSTTPPAALPSRTSASHSA